MSKTTPEDRMVDHPSAANVDTAAIRAWAPGANNGEDLAALIRAAIELCDALDAERADNYETAAIMRRTRDQRDDARARLDEIRALCDRWFGDETLRAQIRAILDQPVPTENL